ncbi:SDR family oxidoreductase [Fontivita pretiosa]|uniref:SDR family oxidoreductase n=1 Tax=Fontivita pretiosa TaxID=2989684 RepID=UPI003D16DB05
MSSRLKKLDEQVVVITGASSGIGLATARMAAERGARLVVAARNETALEQLCREVAAGGGSAEYVVADVGQYEQVQRIADRAIERFGGFDTWVNNAGVSIYGRIDQVPIEDFRRLFDTNFWGVVHGSVVAAKHLRQRGGALINVGSVVSDVAIPLQGMYSASKHAVKGFTSALRMELEHDGAPVSVTLIKPSAIDTPYIRHAKNYMPTDPDFPPPVYAPQTVAEAILFCAQHPRREVVVGGGGRLLVAGQNLPRLNERLTERMMFRAQKKDRSSFSDEALHQPGSGGEERGGYEGHVAHSSIYTQAALRPILTGMIAVGAGLAAAALWRAAHRQD